mmetsp:Transcript_126972/g.270714  ORF Transcript_126972/g.270714 Transcript_126972/m.270714 type:complete len:255 (-) Transcript_126972:217-981(-)
MRHNLNGSGAGAHDAHTLVAELVQAPTRGTAGIVVIETGGVEDMPLEAFDARHTGQLRLREGAEIHDDVARPEGIPTAGADSPHAFVILPPQSCDRRTEASVFVKAVRLRNELRVGEDFRLLGILHRRDVAELLAKRHVDVGLNVAHGSRVAIPVPSSAYVARLVEDSNVLRVHPLHDQSCPSTQAPVARAHDANLHLVGEWCWPPAGGTGVRVFEHALETLVVLSEIDDALVLLAALGAGIQPLVALSSVLLL